MLDDIFIYEERTIGDGSGSSPRDDMMDMRIEAGACSTSLLCAFYMMRGGMAKPAELLPCPEAQPGMPLPACLPTCLVGAMI